VESPRSFIRGTQLSILQRFHTGPKANQVSYSMGTRGKQPKRDAGLSPSSSAEVKNEYKLYIHSDIRGPSWHAKDSFTVAYAKSKKSGAFPVM
jgi:hypothetical protein